MIGRIVEIASDGRYLHKKRGSLVIKDGDDDVGSVPLDDVSGLILNARGIVISSNLLAALAERACPVVICAPNLKPAGVVWAFDGHHVGAKRLDAQLEAGKPLKKRLWQKIVQAKLAMQAAVLESLNLPCAPIRSLIPRVRSGDSSNMEGVGARRYWAFLFGKGFRRDPDGSDVNALLNYGYAVLRACVARHVMACGLHPGVSLNHRNEGNPLRLVDDLIEPFRPLVDARVKSLAESGEVDLSAESKSYLVSVLTCPVKVSGITRPVTLAVQQLCLSFVKSLEVQSPALEFPDADLDCLAVMSRGWRAQGSEDEEISD